MPYVDLKLVGKLTKEQKEKIVDEFSATLEKVTKKPKQYTYVSIQEFDASNWGFGGKLLG
ncbi:MAG: 4-oxalocrotonate tautomerase [Candidatus Omnitrophica bacterium CG12_big_fil_rev_8_21_14_0_65_43_15]|uniref:4-oxalocrotonate tautomerase n=1 Tax=Candidatus Taenaricola geysiri TaxID=1974752 RepID=A0A2J0LDQ6_9BACT|nr:MAG: 4-oxalocrotonate tautomerase [Candidatus Omnitrophica bacterium CG1_02_43_210]PIR65300.1 MAG: 4-oxalocrotonate tautomerase [Candidatus Omnitrophica bacterium CG10_big_fil_rev_8_21_14_0_10_43_8]PIV11980.1 MAG: 4-oxalocrotonate tautomerase [Candidatus Omnitrophica bacterium CG03_land_8_20_14_0_80_43_22]PIW65998.1 MAG: 4-oxalocrotonate tautomerase [Candidatus Omnitrophica bacterium CG12_big_fil_rev_8_21_14_0_65_43_15]PIW80317.1 MAG: 4-oxalocrotonate tautomerase [Candidatus Omnitrophica bac